MLPLTKKQRTLQAQVLDKLLAEQVITTRTSVTVLRKNKLHNSNGTRMTEEHKLTLSVTLRKERKHNNATKLVKRSERPYDDNRKAHTKRNEILQRLTAYLLDNVQRSKENTRDWNKQRKI